MKTVMRELGGWTSAFYIIPKIGMLQGKKRQTGNQLISCFAFRKFFTSECLHIFKNALNKLLGLNQNINYDFMSCSVSFRTEALISNTLDRIPVYYRPPCRYLEKREAFIVLGLAHSSSIMLGL